VTSKTKLFFDKLDLAVYFIAFSRPTASPSASAKCLIFGHWLTLCTLNIALTYLFTYLLKYQTIKIIPEITNTDLILANLFQMFCVLNNRVIISKFATGAEFHEFPPPPAALHGGNHRPDRRRLLQLQRWSRLPVTWPDRKRKRGRAERRLRRAVWTEWRQQPWRLAHGHTDGSPGSREVVDRSLFSSLWQNEHERLLHFRHVAFR